MSTYDKNFHKKTKRENTFDRQIADNPFFLFETKSVLFSFFQSIYSTKLQANVRKSWKNILKLPVDSPLASNNSHSITLNTCPKLRQNRPTFRTPLPLDSSCWWTQLAAKFGQYSTHACLIKAYFNWRWWEKEVLLLLLLCLRWSHNEVINFTFFASGSRSNIYGEMKKTIRWKIIFLYKGISVFNLHSTAVI